MKYILNVISDLVTTVKAKVKGQGCRFMLTQSHYFWSTVNVHYVSTIDFKVQFMQVYSVIQIYM